MCGKLCIILIVLLVLMITCELSFAQSQSEYALIRRQVFGNPPIWKLTREVTNTYWDIDLFNSPRAGAQSYIMTPAGDLWSGVSFKLDYAWNRIVYSEVYGYWIREYGSHGMSQCQFWWPRSIASLAPFNDEWYSIYHYIYVADKRNSRIVRLQYNWQDQLWICNTPITGGGLEQPNDIDINENFDFWPHTNDYLWVLNGTSQIKRFSIDGTQLNTIGEYGCDGQNWQFCRPTAVVSGRSLFLTEPYDEYANTNDFYVADAGNNRIVWLQMLSDGQTFVWMNTCSTSSSIVDLEVDIFGHVWAVDHDAGTITKYRFDLFPLCTFGSSGVGENQFLQPISITNNGGYYGFGNMSVMELWTDSSGGQYFAIGTDILDFNLTSSPGYISHVIDYVLVDPSDVAVKVYNEQGQLVKTLFDGEQFSGPCSIIWDGSDNSGLQVATGNYRVMVVDTCTYWNVVSQEPVNVVTKEAWFYHSQPCCNGDGRRGNVDGITGPGGEVDAADMSYLVDFLFKGGQPPPCVTEGNVDGIIGPGGPIEIADLSYLVDFLFKGGPPPPACP